MGLGKWCHYLLFGFAGGFAGGVAAGESGGQALTLDTRVQGLAVPCLAGWADYFTSDVITRVLAAKL